MVSMREELDHVKDYLELEKARFEDKLTVTYDVPTQMDMRIPTLIFHLLWKTQFATEQIRPAAAAWLSRSGTEKKR